MCFADSSMRYANLDNANLKGADFSGTDMTGVRLDETAQVDALTISNGDDAVIAAYGDGPIRAWTLQPTGAAGCMTLINGLDHRAEHIAQLPWGDIVSLGDGWLLAFAPSGKGWMEGTRFRVKMEFRSPRVQADILTVLQEEANRTVRMLVIDANSALVQQSIVSGGYGSCDTLGGLCSLVPHGSKGILVLYAPSEPAQGAQYLPYSDISALALRAKENTHDVSIATGHRDGFLRLWILSGDADAGELYLRWEQRVHDGNVTTLAFLGDERVVSGGTDRAICLVPIEPRSGSTDPKGQFEDSSLLYAALA